MAAILLAMVFLVAVTGVWLTLGRTMMALAPAASEVPVGRGLELLVNPLCALHDVRLREVVSWRDDLLVGFTGGNGTWLRRDSFACGRLEVIDDQVEVAGELCFPRGARDARTRRSLELWRDDGRVLVAVINDRVGLGGLGDESSSEALTIDLAYMRRLRPEG
jgi:hypothetical protein